MKYRGETKRQETKTEVVLEDHAHSKAANNRRPHCEHNGTENLSRLAGKTNSAVACGWAKDAAVAT